MFSSGNLLPIGANALGLLGISGIATLGTLIAPPMASTGDPATGPDAKPSWSQLVYVDGEIDVSRVQMLFFTILVALFVVINIVDHYAIPDIPDSYLGLMGISNGVYILRKFVPPAAPGGATQGKGVKAITVTARGQGYDAATTVALEGGGGSGARGAVKVAADGTIVEVSVIDQGKGYTSAPKVTFSDPTQKGSGAAATAELG
jgi:hypothetical protein